MFKAIFFFELKQWFKKPAFYIYFLIFLLIGFLAGAIFGGLLDGTLTDSNIYINSAGFIGSILNRLNTNFVGIIILVAIMAPAVYKDFQYNSHAMFFTKPIKKLDYLLGRFLAGYLVALLVFLGAVFGYMIACALVPADTHVLGPFHWINYWQPYLFFMVPNTLLIGAIFFSLVTFTRSMVAGYISCLVLVVLLGVANAITADIDNKTIAAMLDPFGGKAFGLVTQYWTPEEQNTRLIPLAGAFLYNRLLWLGIAFLIALGCYFKFQFSQFLQPIQWFRRRLHAERSLASKPILSIADIPRATQVFGAQYRFQQLRYLTRFEWRKMVRSVFFPIVVILIALLMLLTANTASVIYGTDTYPRTYQILDQAGGVFGLMGYILIVFYAGILVFRERDARIEELTGTSPVPSWMYFLSKLFSLWGLMIVVLLVVMVMGIGIQTYQGYYHYEIGLYLKSLFGFHFPNLIIACCFAMAVQVFVNNRYVGYFALILFLIGLPILFSLLGWENPLYDFNSSGSELRYSDMNGFGHTVFSFYVFKLYWIGFSIMMAVLASWMWQRGKETNYKARLVSAKRSIDSRSRMLFVVGLCVFVVCGGFIYYNIKILNTYHESEESNKQLADFEKKYRHLLKSPQPRVVASYSDVDIYPKELAGHIKGYFWLKNKHASALDTIYVNSSAALKIKTMQMSVAAQKVLNDTVNAFFGYKLQKPLQPGDSIRLDFEYSWAQHGFNNDAPETDVVYNGSFFNNMAFMPSIGYPEMFEMGDNTMREKYGLPPKARMANVDDREARKNNYLSGDADWIRFETIVSTEEGQTAIAPGYLEKEWSEEGRHYFHYKMDSPILNFYAFQSARYTVKRERWKNINLEIYYHKGHEYNLDRMMQSMRKALDYYTTNFGPYQHRQVRIIEFPRYAAFAQSFPNTIPYSEGIGFIARVHPNDPLSIDYPFYVTAHEVAHQWWGHQVVGGNVQGSTLMSETLAQYSALMVMEHEYGPKAMRKFLKYEMNLYLRGRTTERRKELPLIQGENQGYIHYNKGSVVMYALKDYIGEDSLNSALRRYLHKTAYQEPPYTNSLEFLAEIYASTPDSLHSVVSDLFEKITLFENTAQSLQVEKQADGRYKVLLKVKSQKFQANELGKQTAVPINDWIDIGVFDEAGEPLYLQKRKINKEEMSFEILVDKAPGSAGIDPYNKLIDRKPDDNTYNLKGGNGAGGRGGQKVTVTIGS